MLKISAMTEEEIRASVIFHLMSHIPMKPHEGCLFCRLAYTWAVAQAKLEQIGYGVHGSLQADHLNAVLSRIGWPQDGKE